MVEVSQIWLYPLKSARGIRVQSAKLSLTGFEHDRSFMLIEPIPSKKTPGQTEWKPMTLRQWPKMGLLRTEIKGDMLRVFVKNYPDSIEFPLVPDISTLQALDSEVDIWAALVRPFLMPQSYSTYFSTFLGTPCKLVYVNLSIPRHIQGTLPPPTAQNGLHPVTGLSDGMPYLICAEESMQDLNSRMESPMSIIRFRPNIVVKGGKAFEEDCWAEVEMGEAGKFWLLSRSPRCQLPNVDVEVGIKNKDLPYKALSKYRRIDKGSPYSPSFGMNAVADRTDRVELHVGDKVEILRIEEPQPHSNVVDTSRLPADMAARYC